MSNVRSSSYNLASGKGLSLPKNWHLSFDQIRVSASPCLRGFLDCLERAYISYSLQWESGFELYSLAPSFSLGFGFRLTFSEILQLVCRAQSGDLTTGCTSLLLLIALCFGAEVPARSSPLQGHVLPLDRSPTSPVSVVSFTSI